MSKSSHRGSAATIVALVALAVFLVAAVPAFAATTVTGAGATFPLPLYQQWAIDYNHKVPSVQVSYSGGGSGFGISEIKAGHVNFGGTDAPLSRADLDSFGLVQFPTCVGGVVPIVNIPGIKSGRLKLTGGVLADIYLGKITKWNSKAIKALNPTLSLPSLAIAVVYRSDASGTSWIFTNYLARVSTVWAGAVGIGKTVAWPRGVGANGNPGVANTVKGKSGAIGYVEFAYAKSNKIPYTQMKNRSGRWVLPTLTSFGAAAAGAKWSWSNGFYQVLVNQPGAKAWPITGATFVLIKRSQSSQSFGRTMLKFFNWAYTNTTAKNDASRLNYVAMPSSVVSKVQTMWKLVKASGKPCWP